MKRILIIEDDHTIGEVEKDYFELSGFDVTLVSDGKKGLGIALEEDFDLYVLDIMLPDVNGLEIAKAIREKNDHPIIMVTAKSDEPTKIKGFSLRIDDYVTKPFSPAELVARANAHIKRYETLIANKNQDNIIEIRGLTINTETREIYMNGHPVELTKIEFDLLLLLASTPNKIFTKEEIFEKIWGYDYELGLPTLAVHIRNLREKLEFNPSKPEYIVTVWGVGYRISQIKVRDIESLHS